jgi:hypothetical protein
MWKKHPVTLWCCLAALPLLGCADAVTAASQQGPQGPAATADYSVPPSPYPVAAAAPAAILVVLPGAGAFAGDPALWRSQGVDIVTPPPTAFYRLAAEQQAVIAQMMAAAQRLADAPIWLMGPSQEIEAALAAPPPGGAQVSGVVETSAGGPAVTCSESFSYFDPGTGAKPQVTVSKSGNCPPGSGFGIGSPMTTPAAPPSFRPNAPRVIEASVAPDSASRAAHRAAIKHLTALIKAAPSS